MTEVVDSGELLRRLQRARACAEQERSTWWARSEELRATDPDAAREAGVRTVAVEAVLRVLDEVLTPGRHADSGVTE